MFTGIIEETGVVRMLRMGQAGAVIRIAAEKIPPTIRLGDSVAVNGVCLTAVEEGTGTFACDISAETLRLSSLGRFGAGTIVNLERPMAVGDRLGGHIVQGHVDGLGRFLSANPSGRGVDIEVGFPRELERYLVVKGSIAVDGISLTIASLKSSSFTVAVIPHTYEVTNLKHLKAGDPVNLEADILAKYIERFFQLGLAGERASKLTVETLREQGFK